MPEPTAGEWELLTALDEVIPELNELARELNHERPPAARRVWELINRLERARAQAASFRY